MAEEKIYEETASKLLVQALLAGNDIETLAALGGLRRHIEREGLEVHDIKVFCASGVSSTWMRGVMGMLDRAHKRMAESDKAASLYRQRLAVLETAFRRLRNISRDVGGSNTKDHLLQWAMQSTQIDDTDKTDDPTDRAMARLLSEVE